MAGENSNTISNISGGCNEGLSDIQYFSEDGVYYAFAPALDLLGYGLTQDEAQRSLEVVFQEYIRYGVENNTFGKDLHSLRKLQKGWDGYNAEPIPEGVIREVWAFLLSLEFLPRVFPTARGSVQVEYYYDDDNFIEIEISKAYYSLYMKSYGNEIERTVSKEEAVDMMNRFSPAKFYSDTRETRGEL